MSEYKQGTEFPDGEQQGIAAVRAIAAAPEIPLADEPTEILDNENSANIVEILIDMAHRYGEYVVVITHAVEVVGKIDIVLRMNDGILAPLQESTAGAV